MGHGLKRQRIHELDAGVILATNIARVGMTIEARANTRLDVLMEEISMMRAAVSAAGGMTLAECEAVYMDGCADDVSGTVEAPTGHFYRVGRYLVVTDSQGFRDFQDHQYPVVAQAEFHKLDVAYAEWDSDDGA